MNVANLDLCKELHCETLVGYHGAKGYCPKHYKRLKRQGNPSVTYPNKTKHGMTGTTEFWAWDAMLQRCENKSAPNYKWYGARGISVCERWHTFENFIADMGRKPTPATLCDQWALALHGEFAVLNFEYHAVAPLPSVL